ncbi:MAG: alkaline phosphatase [Pseudomonadota bacterium]
MQKKTGSFSSIVLAAAALSACAHQASSPPPVSESAKAKNVILMVSDGIGFNGWLAADYYQGLAGEQSYQIARPDGTQPRVFGLSHDALNLIDASGGLLPSGADPQLAVGAVSQGYNPSTRWDRFDATFVNDFDPVGERYTSYTDSAAAGTALLTGRKTANGRINMDWSGDIPFQTLAQIAMDEGLSAGAVSSVMISHATPASVIAHNVSRNNYADIFNEMVASDLAVIMGAGHPLYDSSGNAVEPEDDDAYQYVGGPSTLSSMTSESGLNGFAFVDAKSDFQSLAAGNDLPARVVGVARSGSTLQAGRQNLPPASTPSGMAFNSGVPDLATMSVGALNVLNQDPDGFFVMIEGGAVDWMGHANDMPRYIEEQVDFNLSVDAVIEWVEAYSSWDETLLIITSDHECGGIWGEGTWTNSSGAAVASDRSQEAIGAARYNPGEDVFNGFLAVQDRGEGVMPGYQFASGNHTNELVPLWVLGRGSELFEEFTRTDLRAKALWGDRYGWDGHFVENTSVFDVVDTVLKD